MGFGLGDETVTLTSGSMIRKATEAVAAVASSRHCHTREASLTSFVRSQPATVACISYLAGVPTATGPLVHVSGLPGVSEAGAVCPLELVMETKVKCSPNVKERFAPGSTRSPTPAFSTVSTQLMVSLTLPSVTEVPEVSRRVSLVAGNLVSMGSECSMMLPGLTVAVICRPLQTVQSGLAVKVWAMDSPAGMSIPDQLSVSLVT